MSIRIIRRICGWLLIVATIGMVGCNTHGVDSRPATPEQVVKTFIEAVCNQDVESFKECYSKTYREIFSEQGWDDVLREYRDGFENYGLSFDIRDYTFSFKGTDKAGEVLIHFKGQLQGDPLRVIKEEGSWKVNER